MNRFLTRSVPAALFFLTLSLTTNAQDKSEKTEKTADAPRAETKSVVNYADGVREWEAKLHTTDCKLMPNRTLMYDCAMVHSQTRVIQLKNMGGQNDANEVLIGVRNMFDPGIKVYLISSRNAIAITSYPQDLDRIEAFIHTLDVPRKNYRLTFTVVDSDAGKRMGVQHFALVVADGQRATMKQGSKVPVVTGVYTNSDKTSQDQLTYLDVGLSFDVTPTPYNDGLQLKLKVEQSAIADTKTGFGDRDPIVRQSVYEGVPDIPLGKPATIGSLDVPNTTRHLDIEVLAEPL